MSAVAAIEPRPVIRHMRAGDLGFITASWVDSYRDGYVRSLADTVTPAAYYQGQRLVIKTLLDRLGDRPGTFGIVAATPDYDEAILGWAVGELPDILHYVYVKDAFRHLGIARRLVGELGVAAGEFLTYTHTTARAREILAAYPNARFNPWLLCARTP